VPDIETDDEPVDLMRVEDLEQANGSIASPKTALLEFQGATTSSNGRRIAYETLLAGEKRIIGNANVADLSFACLRQPACLELRFDSENLIVFRLRQKSSETADFDEVLLNEKEAPVKFVFETGDLLSVNGLEIRLSIVDEEVARLLTEKSAIEAGTFLPVVSGETVIFNRRFRGRRQVE
jgi:uncharacterized small protein (DUF1192 family)